MYLIIASAYLSLNFVTPNFQYLDIVLTHAKYFLINKTEAANNSVHLAKKYKCLSNTESDKHVLLVNINLFLYNSRLFFTNTYFNALY